VLFVVKENKHQALLNCNSQQELNFCVTDKLKLVKLTQEPLMQTLDFLVA